ncbi:MAG: hypothetical protein AAGJ10_15720 [Bacteroidota bacterium]
MTILKYFHEEPAALEVLSADTDPDARQQQGPTMALEALLSQRRYYRGYLAGTVMAPHRVGLTAVQPPALYTDALSKVLAFSTWRVVSAEGHVHAVDDVREAWATPERGTVLVGGAPTIDTVLPGLADPERRAVLDALQTVLDADGVAAFAEPAHDGFDWSLFAPFPMKDKLLAAWAARPTPEARRFLVPFQKARSEQKFYFETWMLDAGPLPDYIEEA